MKTSGIKLCLVAIACCVLSTAANAAVNYTSVAFDSNAPFLPPPAPGQSLVTDFNTVTGAVPGAAPFSLAGTPVIAPGYTFTWTPANLGGLYIAPLVSGIAAPVPTDNTNYFAVLTNGTATLKSTGGNTLRSLSVLLGSLDNYNQLTFRDINGNSIASYTGFQLFPPADGNQFAQSTNREFYFTFDAADKIAQVDFQSFGNSFEFDNIYAAVPEPSVWLMLIAGFGLVGTMLRRRNVALAV